MAAFVMLAPLIMQLLTMLPGLIHSAELVFSGHDGAGAAKKDLVLTGVKAGMSAAVKLGGIKELEDVKTQNTILEVAGAATDGLVAVFNTLHSDFGRKTPAPVQS